MSYEKGSLLHEGKAKKVFEVIDQPDLVWLEFKDDLTAFNAQKKGSFPGKGPVNAQIAVIIFSLLSQSGVEHHFVSQPEPNVLVCKKVEIIPLEVVVRNVLAGSTAKKFGIEDGRPLSRPLTELFYKDDDLGDPFINDEQALMIQASHSQEELDLLKQMALTVNRQLSQIFSAIGIRLIDFKLEFGRVGSQLLLADEITPDCCRLWDEASNERLDKDRFRKDLGMVKESYEMILSKLKAHQDSVG